MIEIERKFLVKDDTFRKDCQSKLPFKQAYLNSAPERTIRIRVAGDKAYITIKGISSKSGMSRYEWEKEIPVEEAEDLLKICEDGMIEKERHLAKIGDHVYEIDEFYGDNEGLILAEIELTSEDEEFEKPHWLGEEVTGNANYYNSNLATNPFKYRK